MTVRERFDIEAFNRDSADVSKLFDDLCAREHSNPDFSADHAQEVHHRLRRMTRMVNRIYELQEAQKALPKDVEALRKELGTFWAIQFEMEDLTEAFYYCAFRTRNALRRSIPSMKRFECLGVRDVRNQLLEHPENHDAPILLSRGYGGPEGPKLKLTTALTPDSFQDPGLFVNAREFIDNLGDRLRSETSA